MEECIRDNVFRNVLLLLVNFVNEKSKNRLNIVITNSKLVETKVDADMFFKSGQLLMLLYTIDIKYLKSDNIKYSDSAFYINCISPPIIKRNSYRKVVSSIDITDDIISKSVYNKKFLPNEIKYITEEDLSDILKGFEYTYNIFIKEKFNLLKYLERYILNLKYVDLVKHIKLLNPNDLKKQMKFISAKLRNYHNSFLMNDLVKESNNKIVIDKDILNLYIENAIIGYGKYGLELMWIEYKNFNVQSMENEIVYMALVLAYVGYKDKNKYYIESSKQCINSILNILETRVVIDKELKETIILVNNYINYDKLDEFINQRCIKTNKIRNREKINFDNVMLRYFNEKRLDILNNIII